MRSDHGTASAVPIFQCALPSWPSQRNQDLRLCLTSVSSATRKRATVAARRLECFFTTNGWSPLSAAEGRVGLRGPPARLPGSRGSAPRGQRVKLSNAKPSDRRSNLCALFIGDRRDHAPGPESLSSTRREAPRAPKGVPHVRAHVIRRRWTGVSGVHGTQRTRRVAGRCRSCWERD